MKSLAQAAQDGRRLLRQERYKSVLRQWPSEYRRMVGEFVRGDTDEVPTLNDLFRRLSPIP